MVAKNTSIYSNLSKRTEKILNCSSNGAIILVSVAFQVLDQ